MVMTRTIGYKPSANSRSRRVSSTDRLIEQDIITLVVHLEPVDERGTAWQLMPSSEARGLVATARKSKHKTPVNGQQE
jgi:hypothetical protein